MELVTKTQQAISLYKAQDLKGALKILKDFNGAFDKDELRTLQIAYDVLMGRGRFYKQLGYNIGLFVARSMNIIEAKYNIQRYVRD